MTTKLNLDVASPDELVQVLRAAADRFADDACNLNAAWQDQSGRVWMRIARELDRTAVRCEQIVNQELPR
jgi:hypothetical protein